MSTIPQPSDHFDGDRFRNAGGVAPPTPSKVFRMLREPRKPWPREVPIVQQRPPAPAGDTLAVTFIGHSTFLVQSRDLRILTDPVYSNCAGPFGRLGPRRVRQPGVAFSDVPKVDVVLLSHNHYDHCDLPTIRALVERDDPVVITPLGNARVLKKAGAARVEERDWWQSTESRGVRVTVTPAQHFSARTPWDRNRALWGGFVFEMSGARVYFAGDTGYMPRFREIRERCGAIDLALLPIGAYEPRWFMKPLHMNPAEAVQAHIELGGPLSIGMHFGTFRLTTEGIDDPVADLRAALDARGVEHARFRVLDVGASMIVPLD